DSIRVSREPSCPAGKVDRSPVAVAERRAPSRIDAAAGAQLISFPSENPTFFEGPMNLRAHFLLPLLLCVFPFTAAASPDIQDTRLLTEPAISADRIAFIYAGDLWTCGLDGGNVRRLTSDVGFESSPAFSPDGMWIAFSAQYEGN